ncbi:hypothetical protein [Halorubrum sp. DTA98]|uniref:hypothetical protein n=1 Tax=Halorubrum sp. DTA98 TaxID=3402163 RepID=UPI003AAE290E
MVLGEIGFERAAVWSAVGFALTTVAIEAATFVGAPPTEWVAAGCAAIAAVGVVGFARVGGGAAPCVILAYGPLAGALVTTAEPGLTRFSIGEPLAGAVAAAVAVGVAGYLVGRVSRRSVDADVDTDADTDVDSTSTSPGGE